MPLCWVPFCWVPLCWVPLCCVPLCWVLQYWVVMLNVVMLNVVMLSVVTRYDECHCAECRDILLLCWVSSLVMLSVAIFYSYAKCLYAECRYAECLGAVITGVKCFMTEAEWLSKNVFQGLTNHPSFSGPCVIKLFTVVNNPVTFSANDFYTITIIHQFSIYMLPWNILYPYSKHLALALNSLDTLSDVRLKALRSSFN